MLEPVGDTTARQCADLLRCDGLMTPDLINGNECLMVLKDILDVDCNVKRIRHTVGFNQRTNSPSVKLRTAVCSGVQQCGVKQWTAI